jgi:hypothetical protein
MTGPEHYAAAERLLATASEIMDADWGWMASLTREERLAERAGYLAEAQAHATLALTAATAISGPAQPRADRKQWIGYVSAWAPPEESTP